MGEEGQMKIIVTGGTGFIGHALSASWRAGP